MMNRSATTIAVAISLLICVLSTGCQARVEDNYAAVEAEYAAMVEKQLEIQNTVTEAIPQKLNSLQSEYSDVCGWLLVPNTNVTMPIMCSSGEDDYYLTHAYDGSYSSLGAPFIEKMNSTDFSDPVTVIYGHSSDELPLLFTQLHDFEEAEFLRENRFFFIYSSKGVLTYEIVSACLFNDGHLLESIDLFESSSMVELFECVSMPNGSAIGNWILSEKLDPTEDRIVMLNTCQLPAVEGTRFVVTGVLRAETDM